MGKMMDQGPVLIITFQAQVVMVIRSPKGDIVEGDPVSKLMIVGNLIETQSFQGSKQLKIRSALCNKCHFPIRQHYFKYKC